MNQLMKKKMNQISGKKKKGFTLVELVIVIAIIAILAAMAIPRLGAMRTTARVSNDVAAAKNIATIAATMVANGNLAAGANVDVSADEGAAIRNQLDGRVATDGNSEASAQAFTVDVGDDGGVTVSVNGHELYPDSNGQGRIDYTGDLG